MNLISNLFLVDSVDSMKEAYSLKCIGEKEIYILEKKNINVKINLKEKDFVYINDYYLETENNNVNSNKKIILSKLSFIEILSDEKIFILLENKEELSKKYLWGKIISIDEINKNRIISILDSKKRILKIENYTNEMELGKYFLISNYKIENNIIKFNENTYSYYSSQELYFSTKIKFNMLSVIKFFFIDYLGENKNKYNLIKINGYKADKILINHETMEIVVEHDVLNNNNKLLPTKFMLIKNDNSLEQLIFNIEVLQGFLNKVNCFINYENDFPFCFEYLYIFFNESKNFNKYKYHTININGKNKIIENYDIFESKSRIRFNIANIPFQNDFDQNILQNKIIEKSPNNSFLICITANDTEQDKIYGIFNIDQISQNTSFIINPINKVFNSYYDTYGHIYDYMKTERTIEEQNQLIDECENRKIEDGDKAFLLDNFPFFEDMTRSQLKTGIGILTSFHLKGEDEKKNINKNDYFDKIHVVIKKIELIKNQFSNCQLFRIFSYMTRRLIIDSANPSLFILGSIKYKNNCPYCVADEFNLEEINNINEFSRLFMGYLQLDSYILYNYQLKYDSYSFSIEPLFIIKYHLKSNYEGFLFLERINNNDLGWTDNQDNVTVINTETLFEKSKYKNPTYIEDQKEINNHAFGISMVLRNEKNSHMSMKKNKKKNFIESPIAYCDNGIIKQIIVKEKNMYNIIIESFITQDHSKIISLAKDFIYGDLLDIKLFIQKDFNELLCKMEEIRAQKKENSMEEIVMKALKTGRLELGDQIYTLNMVKKILEFARINQSRDELPPIFIELEKAMKNLNK